MKQTVAMCVLVTVLVSSLAACAVRKEPETGLTATTAATTTTTVPITTTASATAETTADTTPTKAENTTTVSAGTSATTEAGKHSTATRQSTTATATTTTVTVKSTTATAETTRAECQHENCQEATCTVPAICLTCGRTVGRPLGHVYVDHVCTRCGQKSPEYMSRVEVLGVELDEDTVELLIGDTVSLGCTLVPENATDRALTWVSSNPAAVQVSKTANSRGWRWACQRSR